MSSCTEKNDEILIHCNECVAFLPSHTEKVCIQWRCQILLQHKVFLWLYQREVSKWSDFLTCQHVAARQTNSSKTVREALRRPEIAVFHFHTGALRLVNICDIYRLSLPFTPAFFHSTAPTLPLTVPLCVRVWCEQMFACKLQN